MVAHEERALVADLSVNEQAREGERLVRIGRAGELADAGKHVRQSVPAGEPVEPATHGEIRDRHLFFTERLDERGGDLRGAEDGEVVQVFYAHVGERTALVLHHHDLPLAGDEGAGRVYIEHLRVHVGRHESAHLAGTGGARQAGLGQARPGGVFDGQLGGEGGGIGGRARLRDEAFQVELREEARRRLRLGKGALEELGLVRHADGRERAARALGRMIERRRYGTFGAGAGGGDAPEYPVIVGGGGDEAHALAGLPVKNHAFGAGVSVFAKQQDLQAELHAVGVPEGASVFAFAGRAGFVFDRTDRAGEAGGVAEIKVERRREGDLDEVEFGHHAEGGGT